MEVSIQWWEGSVVATEIGGEVRKETLEETSLSGPSLS